MKAFMRTALLAFASSLALALALAPAMAQEPEDPIAPSVARGAEIVSVEQAQALLGKAPFYDVRAAINYGKSHIKGARSVPYIQRSAMRVDYDGAKDRFDLSRLPTDKSTPVVFYSDDTRGWKSYKAALAAVRAGHTQVKWLREGHAGWIAKNLPVE
jgi:rhodanese-related sulfurtransferase